MTIMSHSADWTPIYNRFLALSKDDQHTVGVIYHKLQVDCPDAYNHQCMEAALVEFEVSSGRMQMMDGALEYEEAIAGAEIIRGEHQ